MGKFNATYVGEAEGDIEAFGVTFAEGKSVEVDDKFRQKVEGNPFFEIGGGDNKDNSQQNASAKFEAKEKSAGWWAIFDDQGNEVGKSIREADAAAFNAMSDEDKAAYVNAENE